MMKKSYARFLEKFPNDLDNLQKILKLEQRFFLADHNLIYNDKMSMQTGVEVRVPFLDKELTNFAENIPSKIKQKRNQSKWILKKIMEKYLPKDIVYRSKSGFGVPLRKWIKYDLDEWLQEVLSEKKLKENGIFNPTTVQELIKNNKKGIIDASYIIFSILCVEIWCDNFLKKDNN